MNTPKKQSEYVDSLSFSSFIGTFFFLGVYLDLLRTLWLSLLVGGLFVWLFLTLLIHLNSTKIATLTSTRFLQRLFSLAAIAYGGFSLCGFFFFAQQCLFPGQGYWFFPVCFMGMTGIAAHGQLHTLERTSRYTAITVSILLILTVISMMQKLWDETSYVKYTWTDLFVFDPGSFMNETWIVTAILLLQTLVLITVLEQPVDRTPYFRSIRRAMIPAVLFSSLLHLISALALGASSFEYLTWPIYDMLSLPGYAEYLDRAELLMLLISLFCEGIKAIVFFRAGRRLFMPGTRRLPQKQKIHTA